MTGQRISYAQNAEDIRVWRALRHMDQSELTFVDVGANEPRHLSITASLHDLGWRGLRLRCRRQQRRRGQRHGMGAWSDR